MKAAGKVTGFSVGHPMIVTLMMVALTVILALGAALPSVWPEKFQMLSPVQVDTDPENMLAEGEPVRTFHEHMKEQLSLHDMVVLGVVNESHPDGVFNPDSLRRIYELTEYAKTLKWDDPDNPGKKKGVIEADIIAPSTVDNMEQGGLGTVRFEWLMRTPPETKEEAVAVRDKAARIPFLNGTVLSEDGKALCIYLPLTSKDVSYRVYTALNEKVAEFKGDDHFFITGLPVAEDTFGVEMFKQMAISAPIAMLVIFLLMLFFFRKFILVVSPMIVAMVSVICTMGLLIITGNTVHIMSSMIPIFIMPIAVLDAVHILSDFFDRYRETGDRETTIRNVMDTLFVPMLYTSLTTAAGFASLALTPIPPVQIFGLFVAFGVIMAWIWTVTFVPAFVMFIPERSLSDFGSTHNEDNEKTTVLVRLLSWTGKMTFKYAKVVIMVTVLFVVIAGYGIGLIQINDNPTKWFTASHPIRVADRVLNDHFGGTYMAYLALEAPAGEEEISYLGRLLERMAVRRKELVQDIPAAEEVFGLLEKEASDKGRKTPFKDQLLTQLESFAEDRLDNAPDERYEAWDEALVWLGEERQSDEVFKDPAVLKYISRLQDHLQTTGVVGKSNSLSDIVKTVHRELLEGKADAFRVPDTRAAVGQCLITYQNSHRPQDLWHFVTPDYRTTSLWIQLRSGDNRDMSKVIESVETWFGDNPPPHGLEPGWFGLTYINVIWQEKMVNGMLQAFLGSFLIVLFMMMVLYRSALWGLLSMIPLLVTVGMIYGLIGLIGKDYDMPVAVLSALSLGLAVDYAIHFLSRSRQLQQKHGAWKDTAGPVFGEPARAISRNIVVVGVGFLPLLAAPLVPYQTVGIFIAAILILAGVATLLILPAMITLLDKWLFADTKVKKVTCHCVTCIMSGLTMIALIVVNVHQFAEVGWSVMSWLSLAAVVVLAGLCASASRRESCNVKEEDM